MTHACTDEYHVPTVMVLHDGYKGFLHCKCQTERCGYFKIDGPVKAQRYCEALDMTLIIAK